MVYFLRHVHTNVLQIQRKSVAKGNDVKKARDFKVEWRVWQSRKMTKHGMI